jgi:hypothetical protein
MTTKYATGGVFGKLIRDPHFWAPAVAVGAGVAVSGGASAIQKITEARRQAKSFKEMQELHPTLKTRDPMLVKRIYSSLHNVNPMMAGDPMVAGAWVDTIIESGGLDQGAAARALLEGVKDLAQIRSHVSQARKGEGSLPKALGAGTSSMVTHAFGRAKEVEKEVGDIGVAHKQIADLQGKLKFKAVQDTAREVERYNREAAKNPAAAQAILETIKKKYSSAQTESPGQRLIAACAR